MSSSHFIQGYSLPLPPLLPGGALSAGWLGMLTPLGPYFAVTELRIEKKGKKKKKRSTITIIARFSWLNAGLPTPLFLFYSAYPWKQQQPPNWGRTGRFFPHIITAVTRSSPNPLFPQVSHFYAELWDQDSAFICWSSSTASLLKMYSSSQCSMFILIKKTSLQWNSRLLHKPFPL